MEISVEEKSDGVVMLYYKDSPLIELQQITNGYTVTQTYFTNFGKYFPLYWSWQVRTFLTLEEVIDALEIDFFVEGL